MDVDMEQFMIKFKVCYLISAILFLTAYQAHAQQRTYSVDEELLYRINFGRYDDVKKLLDKGASPNAISSTGEYAITVAIGRDDKDSELIVKALLDKGANPNIYDKANEYPIVSATINNKTQTVADLLEKNANYHAKSATGKSIVEIARGNNNQKIVKMIQDKLDQESTAEAYMHTPERFKKVVRQYAFDSCTYQYWSFVLNSRQDPDKDKELASKIDNIKTNISSSIEQIQIYYPTTQTMSLQKVSENTSKKIYYILDAMISNHNRRKLGVGVDDDANSRCHKIADDIEINFVPANMRQSPAAAR